MCNAEGLVGWVVGCCELVRCLLGLLCVFLRNGFPLVISYDAYDTCIVLE